MKKKKLILTIFLMLLLLCGCDTLRTVEEELNKLVLESSGIAQDADYNEYRSLSDMGLLDENGLYILPVAEACAEPCNEDQPAGSIQISFPENAYLNTRYFFDADFKQPVDPNKCWLDPGEMLYAMEPKPFHPNSNKYAFKEFRVSMIDEEGNFKTSPLLKFRPSNKGYVLLIPADFSASMVSVEAIGKYEDRILTFSDFLVDESGKMTELSGKWMVENNKVYTDSFKVSPMDTFKVTYSYPSNADYYFVSSVPEPFYYNDDEGKVVFSTLDAHSDISDYRIELHPYIDTELKITTKGFNLQSRKITVNGKEERISWRGGLKAHLPGLKWGDTIKIESEVELVFESDELSLSALEKRNGLYYYTLEVPVPVKTFYFDPTEYKYEHGTLVFRYRGMEVVEPLDVIDGSEISYEAAEIDEGYWLPGEDHSIRVNGNETKSALEAIRFYPQKPVEVFLPQPEAGGAIDYSINGLPVTESQMELDCGTAIQMNFRNWNGWISRAIDGEVYIVSEKEPQIVSVKGMDVNGVFYESEAHKCHVKIGIDYSVGDEASFSVKTSDNFVTGKKYDLTGFNNSKQIIFDKTVGTESPIVFIAENLALVKGKALKFEITRTDSEGIDYSEILYREKTPVQFEIPVYREEEQFSEGKTYKSIQITVREVGIKPFDPIQIPNASIEVSLRDTSEPRIAKKGDLIDMNRLLHVRVVPDEGYYINGVVADSQLLEKDIHFYDFDMDSILGMNEIQPMVRVELKPEAKFGTCKFLLEGKAVSGYLFVEPSDWLTMTYQVPDSGKKLIRKDDNFLDVLTGLVNGGTNTVRISVSSDLEGRAISCDDYFIVEGKGE